MSTTLLFRGPRLRITKEFSKSTTSRSKNGADDVKFVERLEQLVASGAAIDPSSAKNCASIGKVVVFDLSSTYAVFGAISSISRNWPYLSRLKIFFGFLSPKLDIPYLNPRMSLIFTLEEDAPLDTKV